MTPIDHPAVPAHPGRSPWRRAGLATLLAATVATSLLGGCAPLLLGGAAVGSGLVVADRRTSGIQLEDQSIEFKTAARARDLFGERGHVSATSYNRVLLLTGEVPSEADRARMEDVAAGIENVRSVVNELAIAAPTAVSARSNDAVLTSKVKASMFVDAKDLQANAFKVVTERGIVYLMGRVTEREAGRAADLARSISGVAKVIRVFEIVSEADLARN